MIHVVACKRSTLRGSWHEIEVVKDILQFGSQRHTSQSSGSSTSAWIVFSLPRGRVTSLFLARSTKIQHSQAQSVTSEQTPFLGSQWRSAAAHWLGEHPGWHRSCRLVARSGLAGGGGAQARPMASMLHTSRRPSVSPLPRSSTHSLACAPSFPACSKYGRLAICLWSANFIVSAVAGTR